MRIIYLKDLLSLLLFVKYPNLGRFGTISGSSVYVLTQKKQTNMAKRWTHLI